MLVKEALAWAVSELENFSSKQLEARILLASVLGISQESLLLKYNNEISESERHKFSEYVKQRKLFKPIAYIIGKKEFYGRNFLVNNHTLIPRTETETLIDIFLLEYEKNYGNQGIYSDQQSITILDLGTGSGTIAITLAAMIPTAEITATDISGEALKLAIKNAELNKVASQLEFVKSDWYSRLAEVKFDFIVSNPPYISLNDISYVAEETIKYEPEIALFADNNGLINYERIISAAPEFLTNKGKIFLEIGFNQGKQVADILKRYEFKEIKIHKDLSNHERVAVASLG